MYRYIIWLFSIIILVWVVWVGVYFTWGKEWIGWLEEPENGIALSPEEFLSLSKNDDYILIDIRNEWELEETWVIEWLDAHKNVYNLDHVTYLENMDKQGKYLFYCAHWNRSDSLKKYLMSLWFEYVYDLEWWETERTQEQYPLIPWKYYEGNK